MRGLLRKLVRGFAVTVAVGLILMAVGAGLLRLAVIQLPSYQGEIQDWVRAELGIDLSFSRLDARWSLLGPDFSFLNATVSRIGGDANPIVSATEATITLSPFALFTEGRLDVNRLTLSDSSLSIERIAEGMFRLANLPEGGNSQIEFSLEELPPVTIVVNNGQINYTDRVRQQEWAFDGIQLQLVRDMDQVVVEVLATPPESLAERIEVSAQLDTVGPLDDPQTEWRIFGDLRGLDLAVLPDVLPESLQMPAAGQGDVSFWVEFAGNQAQQATLSLALAGLQLGGAAGGDPGYDDVDVTLELSRLDAGWSISASNLELDRGGRAWPSGAGMDVRVLQGNDGLSSVAIRSDFLRLEDLSPLFAVLPPSAGASLWPQLELRGDLREVEAYLARGRDSWSYSAAASFDGLQIATRDPWPGVQGLSGQLQMDSRSGRLDLASRDARLDWPRVFAGPLDVDELTGRLTWRQGADGLRLVSDELVVNTPDGQTRSTLEATWPIAGGLPAVVFESRVQDLDAVAAKRYFPVGVIPQVSQYLNRAILAGRVPQAEVSLVGPLAAFPFADGEGQFHARVQVEEGTMAYVANWPAAEDLSGVVTFANAGWEADVTGRVLGNRSENTRVSMENILDPVLGVAATTRGPLQDVFQFLKEAPLIAQHLGPDLLRLQSGGGMADVSFELELPLLDRNSYRLQAGLDMIGGELAIDGFGPAVVDIVGSLRLDEAGAVSGERLRANFLDAPVTFQIAAAGEPGYLADIVVEGPVDADSIQAAFNLPFVEQIVGESWWVGHVLLPENRFVQARREPFRVNLESILEGVDLRFPEPLDKPPMESMQLAMEIVFSEADRVNINGQLGEDRRFALSYRNREGELSFRRGGIRFGGAEPLLPPRDGLSVSGELGSVDLDDWWELFRRQVPGGSAAGVMLGADLEIVDLSAFGQSIGPAEISVQHQAGRWQLVVDSEPVAGEISWPIDLSDRPQMLANLQRLHITTEEMTDPGPDPRELPGVIVHVNDFALGTRRFGVLDADIQADPEGLNIVSFSGESESFFMEGSGGWYQRPQGQETRLVLTASSENVAGALEQLGFDPITEAEGAQLALNVIWPSGPSPDWEESITGGLNLRLERGSILNLDPGAGRMVGLMSIAALPRRLALDFRDVFNRGLVFDEMSGDFVIIDGDAYTDNLHLTGPVVDIGVVGRTGLRDRDYEQHAVVTSEPGRILPAVGFLAGPQVGTALLIFSEIFKQPLNGVGRASYCVTGTWSDPLVERLTAEELQESRLCADLPQLAESVEP